MSHLRPLLPRAAALAVALSAALPACSKTPEPPPSPASSPTGHAASPAVPAGAHPAAPAGDSKGGAEVAWDVPAGWETAPNPSPMRKATYKIKKAEGDAEDAELSVMQAGGSVDQNVQRWIGQFELKQGEEPKRSQRKLGDIQATVVEIRGTFKSGMPGMGPTEPKANWAMLGAIAETPGGATWFFKLTGPEKTVMGAKADFEKLVDSLRLK